MHSHFIAILLMAGHLTSHICSANPHQGKMTMFNGVNLRGRTEDGETSMKLQIPTVLPSGCLENVSIKYVDLRRWGNKMTNDIPCEFPIDKLEGDTKGKFFIYNQDSRAGASNEWRGCSFTAATMEFGEWLICEVSRTRKECENTTMSKTTRESFLVKMPNQDGTFGCKQLLTATALSTAWKEVTITVERHDFTSMHDLRLDWKYMNVSCEVSHDGVMMDMFWHVFDEQIIANPQNPIEARHTFVSRHTMYDAGKRYKLCYTYELFERDPEPQAWAMNKTRAVEDFQNMENPKKCMIFWI